MKYYFIRFILLCVSSNLIASDRCSSSAVAEKTRASEPKVICDMGLYPVDQQFISSQATELNRINRELVSALKCAFKQRPQGKNGRVSAEVAEHLDGNFDLAAIVDGYAENSVDQLASIFKKAFTVSTRGAAQVQMDLLACTQQWQALRNSLGEGLAALPVGRWPHKPALLKTWNASSFKSSPRQDASDRVVCSQCKAEHAGIESWQNPAYYHRSNCPFFVAFPYDKPLSELTDEEVIPHLLSCLDVLTINGKKPAELSTAEQNKVIALWKNFKQATTWAPEAVVRLGDILQALRPRAYPFTAGVPVGTPQVHFYAVVEEKKCR